MMFSGLALFMAMLCLGSQGDASPTFSRDLGAIDLSEDVHPRQRRMIESVIFAFKDQIRDVLEQIAFQAFEYIKTILQNIKVNLLKKLRTYTLSDVFHVIFDGVCDFVAESTPEVTFEPEMEPEHPKLYSDDDYAYALATLFRN